MRKGSLSELSLRELARKCKVSEAAPYRHFKDREGLLAELSAIGFGALKTRLDAVVSEFEDDPLQQFYGASLAYLKMGIEEPEMLKLMFGPYVTPSPEHPELMRAAKLGFLALTRIIQHCQRARVIGPGDPFHKTMHAWMGIHGFTSLFMDFRCRWLGLSTDNVERANRGYCDELLHGMKKSLDSAKVGFTPIADGVTEELLREAKVQGRVTVKIT